MFGRPCKFRSSYEAEVAKFFDDAGIIWFHESDRIHLSDGRTYIPDFYVSDWRCYVEVKGWVSDKNLEKPRLALKDGYQVELVTLDRQRRMKWLPLL